MEKNSRTILNGFIGRISEYNDKSNKSLIDQGTEFCNTLIEY